MKKIIFGIFVFLLIGLSLASAATADLEVLPVAAVSGNPGESVNINVRIKNNGAEAVDIVTVSSSDLTFGTNNIRKPSPSSISALGVGQTKTATLVLSIPSVPAGGYTGTVSVEDASDAEGSPKTAVYAVTVNTINAIEILDVDESTALQISGQEDEIRTATIRIRNTGSTTFTPEFSFNQADFSDGDNDIALTFSNDENIKPGETRTVTITADIANKIDIDSYDGIITATAGTAIDRFNLVIRVHPEVCKDGPIGDELRLDINEPDSGDDFAPGDTINIDVNVENDGSRKDVIVEAFLYNVDADNEIERVESDEIRIGSDDDNDFELEIVIPFDEDVSEDDEYILFIKTYEAGDEDKQCVEEQLDISIERERNDVRIKGISLIPQSAKPGEFVDISVNVINVGSRDEDDVFVRLTSTELAWDETSSGINLDDGESRDNEGVFRFSRLLVPRSARAGTYSILAVVNFDDGNEQADDFATFTVLEGAAVDGEEESELRLQSVSDNGENAFTVSAVVVNNDVISKTYDLGIDASWAQPVATQTFTVNGGDSRTVQLLVIAKDDTETGRYSGVITLREGGVVIGTESFNAAVTGEPSEPTGVTGFSVANLLSGTSGTVLFVIVDIVLIIIAIFFIRLIFKSGDRKKQPKVTEKVKL